jgi:hypothetical protein
VIDDFKQTVSFLVNRTNTLTGVRYKDDKAILAWETGNELLNPVSWSREISAYLKTIDSNHLVLDGYHAGDKGLREEAILDPNVDIVSTHHYGLPGKGGDAFLALIQKNREMTAGRKAYLLGEFGFIPTENVRQVLDTVIQNGTAGALLWSLRYHSREGGFYWHSEPFGLGLYKAYHWPGFPSGEAFDEIGLLKVVREKAFAIQGALAPPLEPPAAPSLLPISSVAAISWQGSAGAASYSIERAEKPGGPWVLAGMNVDDTSHPYKPLFADSYAAAGKTYYYRVRAWNSAGFSSPSAQAGPVKVNRLTMVDELEDFSRSFVQEGLAITTKDCRQAKEDLNRVVGNNQSYLVYRTSAPIESARVFSFFAKEVADFYFSASPDGLSYSKLEFQRKDFFQGGGEYNYTKPILYEIPRLPQGTLFFKIDFRKTAEIGRVEIEYGKH